MKLKKSLYSITIILIILLAIITQINFVYAVESENEEIYESVLTKNNSEEEDTGNLTYASGVTNEMCNADYWASKTKDADKVLMTKAEIAELNQDIIDGAGTNVFDVTQIQEKKTASERAIALSNSEAIPTRNLYINGELIDNDAYFTRLKNAMIETGFTGDEIVQKYAVAVKRADVRVWPTDDVIGYNETDPDDEIENSILNVNEPFVIRGKCEVDGKLFYWGNSNICPGWVNAENLAICENKEEWLEAWQVDIEEKDFLVVVQDKITLEPSLTTPETSEVKLMLGTVLKLVPENELPRNIAERGTWNNYVVYLPTRDQDGGYVKQYALISQHYDVSIGFLPMTQENILKVAFSCLGNRYGWGGMLGAMDCSLYTRAIYECFGMELPRNTTWQTKVPGKVTDITEMTDEEKEEFLEKQAVGCILIFPGHAMMYTGNENNTSYVISATGSLSDSTGELDVRSMYSVILNPLTTRRKNSRTWLNNLTYVVSFGEIEHTLVKVDEVKATCKKEGNIEYWKCSTCDKKFTSESATTEVKNVVTPVDKDAHDWDEWQIIKEATVDEEGLRTRTCKLDSTHTENEVINRIPYSIEKGNGQTHYYDENNGMEIKANGTLNKLVRLIVDGKTELTEKDVDLKSGSTIATLRPAFLDTLSEGQHTLTFEYTDGSIDAIFNVAKTPVPEEGNSSTTEQEKTDTTTTTKRSSSPKTGDNIIILISLLAVSALGIFVTTKFIRKGKK